MRVGLYMFTGIPKMIEAAGDVESPSRLERPRPQTDGLLDHPERAIRAVQDRPIHTDIESRQHKRNSWRPVYPPLAVADRRPALGDGPSRGLVFVAASEDMLPQGKASSMSNLSSLGIVDISIGSDKGLEAPQ